MSILSINMDFTGMEGFVPRVGKMVTTDTLATITTAGYLNNSNKTAAVNFVNGDFIATNYSDGSDVLVVTVASNNVITLVFPTNTSVPAYVQGITPGTPAASKAVVLDSNSEIEGMPFSQVVNAGILTNAQVATVTTSSTTPATGTCAAQFRVLDVSNAQILAVRPVNFYMSDANGDLDTAITGIAALTNGALVELITGQVGMGTTNASGQIGMTFTGSAGTYYVSFVLPNGKISTSSALVIN